MDINNQVEIPLLYETGRGISVSYKSKNLYSKFDPQKNIFKIINQLNIECNTIYLIASPLLGYGIHDLNNLLPESSILVPIEIDPELFNISDKSYNINLINNGFDFLNLINKFDLSIFRRCEILSFNSSYQMYKEEYDSYYNLAIKQLHNYWKNRYTMIKMGHLWIKNTIKNLKDLKYAKPFEMLKTDKPVVVVGAGESIESVIINLQRLRNSLFILCVDTALQVLLDADIIPDAVVALEAQFYNLPDFYGSIGKKINVIYDLSSYPNVVRNINGEKYYIVTQYNNSDLLNKLKDCGLFSNYIPPLGSVGITAIYLALKITTNNIFLAGLDFSYKLGKTHSRGTPYNKSSLILWNRLFPGDTFIQCYNRPLLKKKNKVGLIENSDEILYEYSLYAKELLLGSTRVFDITKTGMPLGISLVDPEDILNINQQSCYKETLNKDYKINSFLAEKIYLEELEKIENAIKLLSEYFTDKKENQLEILNEISYLFDCFPEADPLKNLDDKMLYRIFITLCRYKRQIK